ncbi:mitochondrial 37S ribosomal protein bS16m MRPS16 [Sporobolomyces koalae]|uniref:mitochondrial 37S ribosomal protein bS16m MRPS16 n=1 Tax=Sporobolomyces koalae TaxID=500713 RepID=UPI0031758F01
MSVRIRLAREHLTRNSASFQLVAINSFARPTARPLELLGLYRPIPTIPTPVSVSPNGQVRDPSQWGPGYHPARTGGLAPVGQKEVKWNEDRIRYWLNNGAKPSKSVERLLNQAGIIKSNPIPVPTPKNKLVISRDRRIRDAVRAAERERSQAKKL